MKTSRFPTYEPFASARIFCLSLCSCAGRLDVMDEPIGASGSAGTENTPEQGGASGSGSPDNEQGGTSGSGSPDNEQGGASGSGSPDDGTGGSGTASADPCACASSDAFMPLGCELTRGYGTVQGVSGYPKISDDGSAVTFNFCFENTNCNTFYWKLGEGARAMPQGGGTWLSGMSGDGTRVLLSPRAALAPTLLTDPEGNAVSMTLLNSPSPLLSANGTVVGVSVDGTGTAQLMRRVPDGQLDPVAPLPFTPTRLTATTPDGSAVAGYFYENDAEVPFRWSAGGLVSGLEGLPETVSGATLRSVSADGTTFAGITLQGVTPVSVFRWTAAGGYEEVGPAVEESPGVDAGEMALNADGSLLAASLNALGAVRWTEAAGAIAIAPQIQSTFSLTSADASVIVGRADGDHFVWTQAAGPRSIRASLQAAGVDFTGWNAGEFPAPLALSADGRVAIGIAFCGGAETLFRAVLPE